MCLTLLFKQELHPSVDHFIIIKFLLREGGKLSEILRRLSWDCRGILLVDFLHEGLTVNAANCLMKRYMLRSAIMLHDKAGPDTATLSQEKLYNIN